MLALGPCGRITAVDVLVFAACAPLQAQLLMIAAHSTGSDDGHPFAWYLEKDTDGRFWPVRTRLDPSLRMIDETTSKLSKRWSMTLGGTPIYPDELQKICLRSALPEAGLGEDQTSWCLDILLVLELRDALVSGQALAVENCLDPASPISSAMLLHGYDIPCESILPADSAESALALGAARRSRSGPPGFRAPLQSLGTRWSFPPWAKSDAPSCTV